MATQDHLDRMKRAEQRVAKTGRHVGDSIYSCPACRPYANVDNLSDGQWAHIASWHLRGLEAQRELEHATFAAL